LVLPSRPGIARVCQPHSRTSFIRNRAASFRQCRRRSIPRGSDTPRNFFGCGRPGLYRMKRTASAAYAISTRIARACENQCRPRLTKASHPFHRADRGSHGDPGSARWYRKLPGTEIDVHPPERQCARRSGSQRGAAGKKNERLTLVSRTGGFLSARVAYCRR